MMTKPQRIALEASLFEDPATLEAIVHETMVANGLHSWCMRLDVSYNRVRAWLESDNDRMAQWQAATAARGEMQASAIDAIGRRLLSPQEATGHAWVDQAVGESGQRPEIDPKAARVAMEAFKTSATWNDPKRYGKVTEHKHTLTVQSEHLAALRSMGRGGKAIGQDLAVIDVEHRIVPQVSPVRPVPAADPIPHPVQPESSQSAKPSLGVVERANRGNAPPMAPAHNAGCTKLVQEVRQALLSPFTRPQ